MTFREWIQDYPDLEPCKYCTWFKKFNHHQYNIPALKRNYKFRGDQWSTWLYCAWGVEHITSRDTEPWLEIKCKYFSPKKHYKNKEELYK